MGSGRACAAATCTRKCIHFDLRLIPGLTLGAASAPLLHQLGSHGHGDDLGLLADHAGHALEAVLVQARDVGAALVDEAVERAADLLVVGLPYRKKFGGDFAIGKTVPYVLKNAPCAVWVAREPMPEEYHP